MAKVIVGAIDRRQGNLANSTLFSGTLDENGEALVAVSGANQKKVLSVDFAESVDGDVRLKRNDHSNTTHLSFIATDGGYNSANKTFFGYYV